METKVNYTLVGLFIVTLTVALMVILLWLTQKLDEKPYKTYQIYMNESVAGLSIQAPVRYNGVEVGYVSDLQINLNNPEQVIITVKVETYVPITEDTRAILMGQGITGIAYIGLQGGRSTARILLKQPDQEYPIIKSMPSFFVRLDQSIQNLTNNINSLTVNIKSMLNQENLNLLHETLQNIKNVTDTLHNNDSKINQSIDNLNKVLNNSAKASNDLPRLMNQLNRMSTNVNKASNDLDNSLQAFANQILPEAYSTLKNLKSLSQTFQNVGNTINHNPSVIIRGKTAPKPGPGE